MSSNPVTVLIVDDDPETVKIFDYLLQKQGYTSLVATTVDEALAHIERVTPDVVLLDLMLPGRNGTELLKHIRITEGLADVYVIVVSAHVLDEHKLPTGVRPDETLRKPIRIPDLRNAVERGLS